MKKKKVVQNFKIEILITAYEQILSDQSTDWVTEILVAGHDIVYNAKNKIKEMLN